MIKIAHFADVHWRSLTRHEEYRASFLDAFTKLRELAPDVILIAGDIVHSKTQGISPELINNLVWWFQELSKIADVHVTLGNHDGLILNPDREDAISPIINAISNSQDTRHKIHLYKQSGVYHLGNKSNVDYELAVFSCFDEAGWGSLAPKPSAINIATFHGPVRGSKTDENWSLEGDIKTDFFDGYDYVMLGDIHKQQFLTEKIAYCGSTIQQNYGETPHKGFLFWEIDSYDFKVKHVEVAHNSPFVTLEYTGNLDEIQTQAETYPERSRFRIRVQSYVTQAERTQIRAAIKGVATPSEVVFKTEEDEYSKQISEELLEDHEALDSYDAVWSLVQEYYSKTQLAPPILERMATALANAWNRAKISDDMASGRWAVKKLEFDNVFGYGEGNTINFDSTSGITGIFGKNRSGKSSICGALTYGLFNGTDRGPIKNLHVINVRKNYCRVRAVISKKGNNILVERQSVKRTSRKGDVSASTHLNLFECDDTGTPLRDLSDEQRRETEKTLKNKIGSLDDFLMTSLASQGDINRFVSRGSAERKTILAKFLRLDILEQLQSVLKSDVTAAKAALAKIPEKEFDTQIYDKKSKIEARKAEREAELEALEKISEILSAINSSLQSSDGDLQYTDIEVADQERALKMVSDDLEMSRASHKAKIAKRDILDETLQELSEKIEQFDYDQLIETKQRVTEAEKNLLVLKAEADSKALQLRSAKREVKKLSDVPCGDAFPTCKYIISAHKAEASILQKGEELRDVRKHVSALKSEMKKLLLENVDQKLAEKHDSDQKISVIKNDLAELGLEIIRLESKIKTGERKRRDMSSSLDRMKMNMCDDETAKQREVLVKKKKIAEEKQLQARQKVQFLSERVGLLTAEVEQLKKDRAAYEENNFHYNAINLLHRSLRRDGIPLQIVKRKLPAINREIANILTGVTGFTVELESDNQGMDIVLDYGDSRRVIECCSGMEKMMASLAIRTALIRVSSLPKSDMLIIDEGFGALDASNIEACTSLLRSLTKTFRSIIIISHIDTVKDVVDNVIEISSTSGHDSKVVFH